MGVGSYLSQFLNKNLIHNFVKIEILIGLIGGFSAAILFLLFDQVASFRVLLYSLIFIIGLLVGIEIPLIMKILKGRIEFNKLVSHVFSFDYIGALLASVAFPLLLVPHLGLVRTSFLFGILNTAVALMTLILFKEETEKSRHLTQFSILSLIALSIGFFSAQQITDASENLAYNDQVIFSHATQYQKITITKNQGDLKLYLNGNLQFNSKDEYRYHEPLVHVGMAQLPDAKKVLILGGGDGMAAREVLKYPGIESITLVDLDQKMTEVFKFNDLLTPLNQHALTNKKMTIINADAFQWVKTAQDVYDFIIVDFPDPSNFSLGKLYTQKFYSHVKQVLAPDGLMVVQSTSPFVARKSFWCIEKTIASAGLVTMPFHAYVPSFGEWGFVLVSHKSVTNWKNKFPENLKFVSEKSMVAMFEFPNDMAKVDVEINKLNNQALVKYFEDEWAHYVQ